MALSALMVDSQLGIREGWGDVSAELAARCWASKSCSALGVDENMSVFAIAR